MHVGDDPENDYFAAIRAGLQARLLLSRPESVPPARLKTIPPHHILYHLEDLRDHV